MMGLDLFSRIKIIAIVVTVIGSYGIGTFLDAHQKIFPYNYIVCMVIGAVATFTGMNIIARLAALMPWMRKALERFGPRSVIIFACALMALVPLLYPLSKTYFYLFALQILLGVSFAFYDVAQQTLNVTESKKYDDELGFFSDYQLMQNLGNSIAPIFAGLIVTHLSMTGTFISLFSVKAVSILALVYLLRNVHTFGHGARPALETNADVK